LFQGEGEKGKKTKKQSKAGELIQYAGIKPAFQEQSIVEDLRQHASSPKKGLL